MLLAFSVNLFRDYMKAKTNQHLLVEISCLDLITANTERRNILVQVVFTIWYIFGFFFNLCFGQKSYY